ncbi:MAG: HEAT repeat domain-containing protein [Gammaproteobacteria bacterium]|nr:HEAT repeat domain-containing protein [Gammaproteobacteria bacterium]MDH3363914.1 HEAT repeat domain-containing protein [Gammaproteobacteria bacterium]
MNRWCQTTRRGVLTGLALLVAFPVSADTPLQQAVREQLRGECYLLVEDQDGARLFVFSTGSVTAVTARRPAKTSSRQVEEALIMTRSADTRTRVRGLTLLSGVDDPAALDAALVLFSDPAAAVREEAVQLIIEHPDADVASIAEIASRDPSDRVRQASAELISERSDDWGD